jgi:HEAT repeat protein
MGLRSRNEALLSAYLTALEAETSDDVDLALADLATNTSLRQDIRSMALARLGERGGEVSVWAIATLLAESDPEIMATAIVSAQMTADARHVDQLARLSRHPLAAIRERVVYALAEIGGDRAVEVCLGLVLDPIAEIRERAVYALLRLGAATSLPTMERMLLHEQSLSVLTALQEARKALSAS